MILPCTKAQILKVEQNTDLFRLVASVVNFPMANGIIGSFPIDTDQRSIYTNKL